MFRSSLRRRWVVIPVLAILASLIGFVAQASAHGQEHRSGVALAARAHTLGQATETDWRHRRHHRPCLTGTPTASPTDTAAPNDTAVSTDTGSPTAGLTDSAEPTGTADPTCPATPSSTAATGKHRSRAHPCRTGAPTPSAGPSGGPTVAGDPSGEPTATGAPTDLPTATVTATATATATGDPSGEPTATVTATGDPSGEPTATATAAATATVPASGSTSPVATATQSDFAAQVVALTNKERATAGCSALTVNATLTSVALAHSVDMAKNNYFAHDSQNGDSPFDRMEAAGYQFSTAAENIAAGYPTPDDVVTGWMNSAGHRANILNCSLTQIGVGYATSTTSDFGTYWTQDFGTPMGR